MELSGLRGLRMTHDLLHGDLSAAVVDNVFLLVGLPMLGAWWLWRCRHRRLGLPTRGDRSGRRRRHRVDRRPDLPGFPLVPTLLSR